MRNFLYIIVLLIVWTNRLSAQPAGNGSGPVYIPPVCSRPINHRLYNALGSNRIKQARALLEKGADINCKNNYNETYFIYYLNKLKRVDNLSFITYLLRKGADISEKDRNKKTPLHIAAIKKSLPCIKLFVAKGADVNAKDDCGRTPLYWAAMYGNLPIAKYLIKKGADIHILNTELCREFTLFNMVKPGEYAVVRHLLEKGAFDINKQSHRGSTFLHRAAENGDLSNVKYLLQQGARIDVKDKMGRTPLSAAVYFARMSSVKILLKNGADISTRDNTGMTPLHLASILGFNNIVNYLLKNDADINAKTTGVFTKLIYYPKRKKLVYPAGSTPLQCAKIAGHTKIVKLLKKYGAKE